MLPGATVLSGTPRIGPPGIMAGSRVLLQLASADPPARLAPLPASVVCDSALPVRTDLAPVLAGRQAVLAPARASLWRTLGADAAGSKWWPEKVSKVAADTTQTRVRDLALPLNFSDADASPVSAVWPGLKRVARNPARPAGTCGLTRRPCRWSMSCRCF